MKRLMAVIFMTTVVFLSFSNAQQITQTVRGKVIDEDGKFPLPGATIVISGSNPVKGAVTDVEGEFRLTGVPVGRITLEIRYMGYEDVTLPNVLVSSGKETILDMEMRESFINVDEVVVKAQKKGEVLNEMAVISSRSFSVEETKRYAGSVQDPSRMVSAYAGVTSDPQGDNSIIVRGNSPKGILWRLEGIEIPNPNHFSDEGSTGGPINAINSELLSNSDFFTGAFAPEYGDALSGVFDMHMRSGNNEKREYSFGFGALGTDIALEGPFSQNYNGSYLINYRYSSLALLDNAGIVDFDGVPKYQDIGFKFNMPAGKFGTFSLFGLGGLSSIEVEEENDEGTIMGTGTYHSKLGVVGLNYTYSFSDNTLMRLTLSGSGNGSRYDWDEPDENGHMELNSQANWEKTSLRSALMFSTKINHHNRIVTGIKFTRHFYDLYEHYLDDDLDRWVYGINTKMDADNWQGYVSWKWRLSDDVTMVSGFHGTYFSLNQDYAIEPRWGLSWKLDEKQTVNMGFGLHSKIESIYAYYRIQNNEDGTSASPNKNLGLSKARHYVLGYEYRFSKNLNAKVELYYQDLYNIPVSDSDTSVFSILNSDEGYIEETLVNEGKGRNYGIEFTLERYFADKYYYLITASLYNSEYKSLENKWRNTRFNGNYSLNVLMGKEFYLGNQPGKKVLSINTKFFINGGNRYTPLLLEESLNQDESVYDDSKAYDDRLDHIFQMNLGISYRINRPKAGHEFLIDIMNVTNAQGRVGEYYDEYNKKLEYDRQLNMLPNIMYRIHF